MSDGEGEVYKEPEWKCYCCERMILGQVTLFLQADTRIRDEIMRICVDCWMDSFRLLKNLRGR